MPSKNAVVKKGNINFFAYQWSTEEYEKKLLIRIYGYTKTGENVYVAVDDFTPYCYVELPADVEWTPQRVQIVQDKLMKIGSRNGSPTLNSPVSATFVEKKTLYYAHKEKQNGKYIDKLFPFFHVIFRSVSSMVFFSHSLKQPLDTGGLGKMKFKVHEAEGSISPVLKLFAVRKLPACGWITAKGDIVPVELRESTCEHEFRCSYTDLNPLEDTTISLPRVLSFDIEANSTVTSAMPKASRPNDKVFQIGCVTLINNKITKYLLSLGEPDSRVGDDVTILKFKTEDQLLVGFTEFVHKNKFNVIIGYNILGWDMEYMINRSKHTSCASEFAQLGCLEGKPDKEARIKFASKAHSAQELSYLDSEGHLYLDLHPIIKREHKLQNYKLGFVTSHFGLATKDPLTAQDIFRCFREFTPESLSLVGKYCVQDAYITLLLYQKLNMWYGLCEMSKTTRVPIFYLFTKGVQIQGYSQIVDHCTYTNFVVVSDGCPWDENRRYVGASVLEPRPGKYNKVLCFDFASLYPSIMQSLNIDYSTYVKESEDPDDFLAIDNCDDKKYLRQWQRFPAYVKMSFSIPLESKPEVSEIVYTTEDLEEAVKKFRQNHPTAVLVIQKKKHPIPDTDTHVFAWCDHVNCIHDMSRRKLKNGQFSTAKATVTCGVNYFRFMKATVAGKGVVPILLENLISQRKTTRKQIYQNEILMKEMLVQLMSNNKDVEKFRNSCKHLFENIEQEVEKCHIKLNPKEMANLEEKILELETMNQVLDKRQSSYKICANSMYGAMGVTKGYLPLVPGASSVTFRGRKALEFISEYIPKTYGGVTVYGDTDSCMCYFPHLRNNKDAVDLAERITNDVGKFFTHPMKLEFEKIYEKFIILSKKRYMAEVANKKGEIISFTKKGVLLARRDNCKVLRDVYLNVAMGLLNDKKEEDILSDVVEGINKMFYFNNKEYSYRDFVITKSIGQEEYKSKTLPVQAALAKKMNERGIVTSTGSRIEYIFTTKCRNVKNFTQGDKAEDVDYFKMWRSYLRVDYLYYIEKQMIKPLDDLLFVGLGKQDFVKALYKVHKNKYLLNLRIEELSAPKLVFEGEPGTSTISLKEVKQPKLKVIKPRKKPTQQQSRLCFLDSENETREYADVFMSEDDND